MTLDEYLASKGAKPRDPIVLAEYDRMMREEVIPKIEANLKAQARLVAKLRHRHLSKALGEDE